MSKNDGGSASGRGITVTTTTKHSVSEERVVLPVDLRDYFAARAMQGMCAHSYDPRLWPESCAEKAYAIADAMLAERAKGSP